MKNTHTNLETTMTRTTKDVVADTTYIVICTALALLEFAALSLTTLGLIGIVYSMCK